MVQRVWQLRNVSFLLLLSGMGVCIHIFKMPSFCTEFEADSQKVIRDRDEPYKDSPASTIMST